MEKHKGWIRYTELNQDRTKSIGSQIINTYDKRKDNTHCAQEQVDEDLKGFPDQLLKCVENGKKHFDDNFYIQILFCLDRVLDGARKNIFVAQLSCPAPFYDQSVYKYHKKEDRLEFLWCVPDIDLCEFYRYNLNIVPDDEKELYANIMDFFSGKLAKREYFENHGEEVPNS